MRALRARIHVIIHGIEYSGDEFLNEPHIFCRLAPLLPFIHSKSWYSMYTLFYYPSAGSDPAPLPSLKNEQTATEWMRKRATHQPEYTQSTTKWIRFSNWVIVKPASSGECFCMGALVSIGAVNCWCESTHRLWFEGEHWTLTDTLIGTQNVSKAWILIADTNRRTHQHTKNIVICVYDALHNDNFIFHLNHGKAYIGLGNKVGYYCYCAHNIL